MTTKRIITTEIEQSLFRAPHTPGHRDVRPDVVAAAFTRTTIAAVIFAAAVIGLLHVLPPTSAISPLDRTISEYGLSESAWLFNAGVTAVALGTAVLFAGLARAGRIRRFSWSALFGGLWSAGLLILVFFPKSPYTAAKGDTGDVHRMASFIAFVSLPVAIALVAHRLRSHRLPFWLGIGSLAWFLPMIGAAINQAFTGGDPWWTVIPLGLYERGMAITEMAAILALAVVSSKRNWLEVG